MVAVLAVAARLNTAKHVRASIHLALALKEQMSSMQEIHFFTRMPLLARGLDPQKYDWVQRTKRKGVQFHFNHPTDWWSGLPASTALIHLSLDYTEDFGMSCFRSIHSGFNLILSAWGAHHEYASDHVTYVRHNDVLRLHRKPQVYDGMFVKCRPPPPQSPPRFIATEDVFRCVSSVSRSTREALIKSIMNMPDPKLQSRPEVERIRNIMSNLTTSFQHNGAS